MKLLKVFFTAILVLLPATAWADSSADISRRLESLEQEIAVLKRQLELKKEDETKKATESPIITASEKDGFQIKSADGHYKLRIRGLVQADGNYFLDGNKTRGVSSNFRVRRARPIFEGTVAKNFDFYLVPDFGSGTNQLVDAYLEYNYFPAAKLKAGKFKVPLGLERLQSDTVANFTELGPTGNLLPNRDIGAQLSGDVLGGTVNYAVGVFNGGVDAGSTDTDNNNDKDVIGRVFSHPFKNSDIYVAKGLGVGIAGSYGNKQGTTLPTYRSAGQASIFTYSSGVNSDGNSYRVTPQLYYYYNNLGLQAEYAASTQELNRVSGSIIRDRFTNQAWQASGIYVLTGEDATYKGVKPKNPFDLEKGQWGAFALVGRVGQIDVDDDVFTNGFAALTSSVTEANSWGLGLSWYLNNNLRTMLTFEQTAFDGGGSGTGDRETENVIFSRFQVVY